MYFHCREWNPRQFNEFMPSTALQVLTEFSVYASWEVSLLDGVDVTDYSEKHLMLATRGSIQSRPTYRPTCGQLVENTLHHEKLNCELSLVQMCSSDCRERSLSCKVGTE